MDTLKAHREINTTSKVRPAPSKGVRWRFHPHQERGAEDGARTDPQRSTFDLFRCIDFPVQSTSLNGAAKKAGQSTESGLRVGQYVFELRLIVKGTGKDGHQCFGL